MDYSIKEFNRDVAVLSRRLSNVDLGIKNIYGVPRGGVPLAVALSQSLNIPLVSSPIVGQTLIVDDIIDSGKTRKFYNSFPFVCLHERNHARVDSNVETLVAYSEYIYEFVNYWWEGDEGNAEDNIVRMIQAIGDDPNRDGLKETPKRVVNMYKHIFSGYKKSAKEVVKEFDGEGYNQIVLLKGIEFYSMCEHHMLPFIGKAHIAYIPTEKVIGISKLARLLEVYSRRLQVQERLTNQVSDAIMRILKPQGSACIIEAEHFCMKMRGVEKQDSTMITSAMRGAFMDDSKAREELMFLIKGR